VRRWERWSFNILSLAIAITGYAYFWMKYGMRSDDPFAVVNHPWQAIMLNLHVVGAPAFILISGIVFNSHVMKKLRAPQLPNRTSGLTSLAMFAIMVISGYLLQIASNDAWLQALVVIHVASGAIFSITYTAHLIISAKLARTRQDVAIREVA
jgi:hypothetical protein